MQLKRLELQGYKTFATRTEFAFDGGITAIVGPNGSGKSNVADSIRWVLGEQSFRSLRGKSTEDMIFAGSAQRARLGMASASLTFDNSDGWLPIDFSEVTLTRRAYRSGENEYLLNGSRVRLRDINELLARSGLARRTYTVIGQGLVDSVLSLRPEERRTLFEEASGITLYQSKRNEAVTRLEETHANLLRVNDIVNEIAPLLRRLEREAERADRHALLSQQLEGLLRTWYGYRWHREHLDLRRGRDALARRADVLERRRIALDELQVRAADLRACHARLRRDLAGWRQESGELQRQMEEVQQKLAVWRERTRLLAAQAADLQAELGTVQAQTQATEERIERAEQEAAGCEAAVDERDAQVAEAQAALQTLEGQRAELAQQLAQAQARVYDLASQAADARNRLQQMGERGAVLIRDRGTHEAGRAAQDAQVTELRQAIEALVARRAGLEAAAREMQADSDRLAADIAGLAAQQAELRTALATAQRAHERQQARYDSLSRLRDEGEGLYAGVRAVLYAADRENAGRQAEQRARIELRGVLGVVAQLIQVPAELEVAMEVALGGHLQDVVVEHWADAEAAIAYLKAGDRGRATFLPLDTVRPGGRVQAPRDADRDAVLGVAADLVQANARLVPVVELLLGRTVVARDLAAARRTFDRLQGGFQVVTLAGELLRSTGSVTGGQGKGQVQGQVLAREREWRELPGRVSAAEAEMLQVEAALGEARAGEEQARARLATVQAQQRDNAAAATAADTERRGLERDVERAQGQAAWHRQAVAEIDREGADMSSRAAALKAALEHLAGEAQAAENEVARLQHEIDQVRGESLYQRLSEARTAAAVARETWEHRRTAVTELRTSLDQIQAQVRAKQKRIDDLAAEQSSLVAEIHNATSRQSVIQGWLSALSKKAEPAETEMGSVEHDLESLETEETTVRTRLREAEASHSQALLAYNQQEDRLQRLRRQLMDDFGLQPAEGEEGEIIADQLRLPMGDEVAPLPVVEELPEGLEEEIQYVRGQMRRVGTFNPNAPAEYAEVSDRYHFLSAQAADLDEAARSLRAVIAELDDVMRSEFHATFKAVAARFKDNFTRLFGGGTARLMLTDPDDITTTGIEISAQPPGKRPQTLALLSGGERALTAVALIFSVLEVNPPPFCILDEVDAMLDEANVGRFRQALETLNRHTQFIIITHNRGTIQTANTIYGVSMGDDSVSQVVSLRLDGDQVSAV